MPRSGSPSPASLGAPGAGAGRVLTGGRATRSKTMASLVRAAAGMAASTSSAAHDLDPAIIGDLADDRRRQAPARADLEHRVEPARGDDGAHPLLALADHDLERRHARLAPRDRVEVDADARACPVGGLRDGTGDARRTEVLEALDEAASDELQAGLDEQLLGERVADLDGRPLGRARLVEAWRWPGRSHRRCRRGRWSSRRGRPGCPGPARPRASGDAPRAGRWPSR